MLWRLLRKWRIRSNEQSIKELRRRGARIGNRCRIYSMQFSTEPYRIGIADDVVIASGVQFVTHHALAALIRHKLPAFRFLEESASVPEL